MARHPDSRLATHDPRPLLALVVLLASSSAMARPDPAQPLTAANWTAVAGFAPDLSSVPWTPGATVDAASRQAVAAWTPPGLAALIDRFALALHAAPYRPIHPSAGYVDATNRYHATASAIPTPHKDLRSRGLKGYVAGLPFPAPADGLEVAFDAEFAYQGDDFSSRFGVIWVDAQRGVERREEWRWTVLNRAMHRTDLAPLPDIPAFARQAVQWAQLARGLAPDDKADAASLYYRFDDPRDQRGYAWIHSSRRDLKLVFGAPGVPWNSTDLLGEDVRGYSGCPEWVDWTLAGRATILAPMHANLPAGDEIDSAIDRAAAPHWNPRMDWEPRPVYVLEGRPKFWTSPYSKFVVYVDAETFLIPLKEGYDRKGELRKVIVNAWNESSDEDRLPAPLALTLAVDLAAGHATVLPTREFGADLDLDPAMFTEGWLRQNAK